MKAPRRLIILGIFLASCLLPRASNAQTQTAVSATITDPSGIPYANGTFSIQLIPTGNAPSVGGAAINGAFNGSLSATGSFSISLWPNASITPASTQWQFTICSNSGGIQPPLGTGTQCTPPTAITISGTAQVLSTTLSNVAPKLTNFLTGGTGSVTSVAATSPIVATPSPIIGGGTISCPTCNTSGATIAGTVTATHIPFASAANTLSDTIGSAVTAGTGAITLTAGADTTVPLSIVAHSATQSGDLFDVSTSSATVDFINSIGKLQVPNFLDQGPTAPAGADAPTQLGFIGATGGAAGASTNGFKGAGAFLTVGDGSAGGATTGNGGNGGDWVLGGGNGGAAGGSTTNNGGNGGAVNWGLGNGGAGAATGNGGNASTLNINPGSPTSGTGGAGGATSGTGGAGADINITTGAGGAAAVGSTTGRGGNITLTLAGAGATGTPGAPGKVLITRGSGPQGSTTTPLLDIVDTWNTSGVVDALIRGNVSSDTSAAGSLLLDLKDATVSKITVDKTGAETLGTDNTSAGTLQLANSAANAHTILASGATTTNTIKGFTTAPTTTDLISCTTASTTCTLTDAGIASTNVVLLTTSGTQTIQNTANATTLIVKQSAAGGSAFLVQTSGAGTVLNVSPSATYAVIAGSGFAANQFANSVTGSIIWNRVGPAVAAGGCGGAGASISTSNGTASFKVNVGTGNSGTCTLTMQAAAIDWICSATDITTTSAAVFITKAKPGGTPATQVTLQNYTTAGATGAWTDNDVIAASCFAE